MTLQVDRKHVDPDIAVLEITGRITLGFDCQQVEWQLAELMKENQKKVVFNLAEVTTVDSTGVGILVMCCAKLRKAGGDLRIAGANGAVRDILKLTSVDKIVAFYPTVAEASEGFQLGPVN